MYYIVYIQYSCGPFQLSRDRKQTEAKDKNMRRHLLTSSTSAKAKQNSTPTCLKTERPTDRPRDPHFEKKTSLKICVMKFMAFELFPPSFFFAIFLFSECMFTGWVYSFLKRKQSFKAHIHQMELPQFEFLRQILSITLFVLIRLLPKFWKTKTSGQKNVFFFKKKKANLDISVNLIRRCIEKVISGGQMKRKPRREK